jgi:hypothetical protein
MNARKKTITPGLEERAFGMLSIIKKEFKTYRVWDLK